MTENGIKPKNVKKKGKLIFTKRAYARATKFHPYTVLC